MKIAKLRSQGFTLIEITIVVIVLGILATLAYATVGQSYKKRAYYTRGIAEMNAMGNAANLYVSKYNDYPPDVNRDVPAGLKEFVQGQEGIDEWPTAPWPGSVYDYENWPPDSNGPEHTYQISVRMCPSGASQICKDSAKKYLSDYVDEETLANWDSLSSVYYCIKGSCRSHQNRPINHPGFCINCGESKTFIN